MRFRDIIKNTKKGIKRTERRKKNKPTPKLLKILNKK